MTTDPLTPAEVDAIERDVEEEWVATYEQSRRLIATIRADRARIAELERMVEIRDELIGGSQAAIVDAYRKIRALERELVDMKEAYRMRFAEYERLESAYEKTLDELDRHAWKPIATCPLDNRVVEVLYDEPADMCFARYHCEADVIEDGATHWREHVPPTTEGMG